MGWSLSKAFVGYEVTTSNIQIEIEDTYDLEATEREELVSSFDNELINLVWLNDRVVDQHGTILEPKRYLDLTEDSSEEGCLQFLNGKINKDVLYVELLAWTGFRDFVRNGLSEVELVIETRKKKHFNKFRLASGATVSVQSNHILSYCNKIFNSKISKEQFEYVFRNTKGFTKGEVIGYTQLSLEEMWMYFSEFCSSSLFKRAKTKKEENNLYKNNSVNRDLKFNRYKQYGPKFKY